MSDLLPVIGIIATILTIFSVCILHITNRDIHVSPKTKYVDSETCEKSHQNLLALINEKLASIEKEIRANKELTERMIQYYVESSKKM